MSRTRCYQNGVLVDADFDADQLSEHLEEPGSVVWVDLVAPDADELALIADELGLHALAVEDAIHAHQRPKLDRYPDHAFLSGYAVRFNPDSAQLVTSELAAFLTRAHWSRCARTRGSTSTRSCSAGTPRAT